IVYCTGRPLEALWHTAVVVYDREYYFGSAGIESVPPGTTMLGQPLKIEDLGETQIPFEVFNEYLLTHSKDRFKGERYDLFHHNCNNFSHETAQFLTGKGIPQYILDLPYEVLSTPMGQMLAPMIQQMTPRGNSIPFTMGDAIERNGLPQSSSTRSFTQTNGTSSLHTEVTTKVFPVKTPVLLDNPLNVEGIMKKMKEFNAQEENKLTEIEMNIFSGLAKGLVRISKESYPVLVKVLSWNPEHRFPALDLLRQKCLRLNECEVEVESVLDILLENLKVGDTNAMLATAALANIISISEHTSKVEVESVIERLVSLLPSSHKKLELYIVTFLHNLVLHHTNNRSRDEDDKSLEIKILLLSSVLTRVTPTIVQVETEERILITLGNLLSSGDQEIRDLAHSMDIREFIIKVEPRSDKKIIKELKELLKYDVDGIDLE
ncbi:uncharacterized protein LOC111705809, partial [Eurytemora carolleeae]|uniref:uncharacterized protein LOC111705809 n=1 Tax=Eurytemora carolleeae TaxID=1294199 RepID=UPI000C78849A